MKKKIKAYNLQETLVVLVIIGILLLIAIPRMMPLIAKAKALEAQQQLKFLYTLEKQYFYMHSKYSKDLETIGFEAPLTVEEQGSANYRYEIIDSDNQNFIARATSVTDFDGDGIFNQWQINQNQELLEIIKD